MRFKQDFAPSLAGTLLVAHPGMPDPEFSKSVVLVSADTPDSGAVGVVLNAPLGKTLAQFDEMFVSSPLADVPVFHGGPSENHLLILTAWQWLEHKSVFKLDFGISEDKAAQLIHSDPSVEIRAFLGYSGWTREQLLNEVKQQAWLLSSVKHLAQNAGGIALWKYIIKQVKPDLFFLAEAPEDPSDN